MSRQETYPSALDFPWLTSVKSHCARTPFAMHHSLQNHTFFPHLPS
jgi:hypothetical protein